MKIAFLTVLFAAFTISSVYTECEGKSSEGCGPKKARVRTLYGGYAWLDSLFNGKVVGNSPIETVEQMKNSVQFFLYSNRVKPSQAEVATVNSKKLYYFFNPRLPTKIVIHGYVSDYYTPFDQNTKNAYMSRYNVNVIVVDWRKDSFKPYHHAKEATVNVGTVVALFIDRLNKDYGYNNGQLHLIGHSLGAHVAGIAGRQVRTGKVGRVTGLDPAAPLYDMRVIKERLGTDSANFVEVLHTGGRRLGTHEPLGHVDLFANGGEAIQPGCANDVSGSCSHSRAHEIYKEALLIPNTFVGYACSDWDTFRNGKCLQNARYTLGDIADTKARGHYFFRTATKSPFGLGDKYQSFTNQAIAEDKKHQNWVSKFYGWVM